MPRPRLIKVVSVVALGAILVGGVVQAQSDDDLMSPVDPIAGVAPADAWVLAAPDLDGSGIAYLRIFNGTDAADVLTRVSSPVAGSVEMRQTIADDVGATSTSSVASIPVPANDETVLEAGGYHLLLTSLLQPLAEGDSVEFFLEFEIAGSLPVIAQVLPAEEVEPILDLPTSFTVESYDNYFSRLSIEAPANTEIKVTLNNYGVLPHNIAFYWNEGGALLSEEAFGSIIGEEEVAIMRFTTPGPGEYFYLCVVHPLEMTGTLIVR